MAAIIIGKSERILKFMNAANNIILIGMMGSGKSTIGKVLADMLKFDFVDFDEVIVQKQGMSIPEIFEKYGEDFFRTLESNAVREFLGCKNKIIATGGGILKNQQNLENLKKIGKIFYLDAPANILYRRINGDTNRPLLKTLEEFEQTLNEREGSYSKAHHAIDAASTPQEIAREIIEKWK